MAQPRAYWIIIMYTMYMDCIDDPCRYPFILDLASKFVITERPEGSMP